MTRQLPAAFLQDRSNNRDENRPRYVSVTKSTSRRGAAMQDDEESVGKLRAYIPLCREECIIVDRSIISSWTDHDGMAGVGGTDMIMIGVDHDF